MEKCEYNEKYIYDELTINDLNITHDITGEYPISNMCAFIRVGIYPISDYCYIPIILKSLNILIKKISNTQHDNTTTDSTQELTFAYAGSTNEYKMDFKKTYKLYKQTDTQKPKTVCYKHSDIQQIIQNNELKYIKIEYDRIADEVPRILHQPSISEDLTSIQSMLKSKIDSLVKQFAEYKTANNMSGGRHVRKVSRRAHRKTRRVRAHRRDSIMVKK